MPTTNCPMRAASDNERPLSPLELPASCWHELSVLSPATCRAMSAASNEAMPFASAVFAGVIVYGPPPSHLTKYAPAVLVVDCDDGVPAALIVTPGTGFGATQ